MQSTLRVFDWGANAIDTTRTNLWVILGTLLLSSACAHDQGPGRGEIDARLSAYAQPDLLAGAGWLRDNLGEPGLMVIDARSSGAHQAGHIPGALNVEWEALAQTDGRPGEQDWGTVLPLPQLEAALSRLGVAADSIVVVYADAPNGWGEDGRIVWILRMVGVAGARMLDGGFGAWRDIGGEISSAAVEPARTDFRIDDVDSSYLADTDWIDERLARVKTVDARTPEEFDGAQLHGEVRGGHLPGAILIPFAEVLDANGYFKPQASLRRLFEAAGLQADDEIVSYCTGGIRSAHLVMTLRLAGYARARNYDQSLYRWAARADLPLE